MHKFLLYVGLLAAGGFTTSTFEYFFKYNLVELVAGKVKGLLRKALSSVKSEVDKKL